MANIPLDADILPPNDDRIFKTMLTHPDAKPILIDIVSIIIEEKAADVQIRNIEIPSMGIKEKAERLDVNCTTDNGDQVDVEMHSTRREEIGLDFTNFINKYIYYLTDLHSSQSSKGKKYYELVKTYQATFCMYNILPFQPGFINRFSLRNTAGVQLTDQINMVIVELGKLNETIKKPVKDLTGLEKWSIFLRYAPDPVHRNLVNEIIKDKEEIQMAAALLQEISQDERERAILRSRRMAETDRVSDLLTAEERGQIKGRAEEKYIIARSLLAEGLTLEFIQKVTGLDRETIQKL